MTVPTAKIRTQAVELKPRMVTEEVVGTVRAKLRATLEAKLSGRIESMPIKLGQKVQKGEIIARLDAAEIAARFEQAEASLEQAEREWKRVSTLFEEQSVTRADYDSAESRLRIAKAVVSEAKALMGYVEIAAPFDGVVTKKWAEVGDLAAPGKPLADFEDPSALQMEADVPEAIAAHIKVNAPFQVVTTSSDGGLESILTEIAPAADPISRTFRVKLEIPAASGLMPGQFARLIVPVGERSSLRLPSSSVIQRGQLELVFAVEDHRARLHIVKTGKRVGDEIEILSGLHGVKTVAVSGIDHLVDGQPVEAN